MEPILDNPRYITEPVGATGIRYIEHHKTKGEQEAFQAWLTGKNPPPPIVERTIINRSEAMLMLQGHQLDVEIDPELQVAVRTGVLPVATRGKNKGKPKSFDDPILRLSPSLSFQYMTEADIDPKTGMPTVKKTKTGVKILAAHFDTFTMNSGGFFSETSKMSAPSWSLPAGPQSEDGQCAAADIYERDRNMRLGMAQQGRFDRSAPDVRTWICKFCYAGKSNYMHRTSQYRQAARLIWLEGSLEHRGIEGTAAIMGDVLAAHMANKETRRSLGEATDYFRIHDSGDMTVDTYLMWRLICERFDKIRFWAPTRMWVFPRFNEVVRRSPPPPNLTLRPSALHFNNPSPLLEGYNPGSTAHMDLTVMVPGPRRPREEKRKADPIAMGLSSWECPAYKNDAHSCAGAGGPKGETDCRFCWNYRGPQDTVSYRAH